MGASLIEIKRRIASTKKTSQITSAMQMVSVVKLNQSEASAKSFQLYASKVREVATHLVATQLRELEEAEEDSDYEEESFTEESENDATDYHDMLLPRPVKKTGYLVITSDRGLAGGYNSAVIKQMMAMLERDHQDQSDYELLTIGGTGCDFFKSRGMHIAYELRGLSDQPTFNEVRKIVNAATSMYQKGVYDELYVCYNHHVNSLSSQFRVEKMLPISDLDASEAKEYEEEYILEPSEDAILDILLPQYAESLIYGAILDAKTAEHAARMSAMRSATDNAHNIIDDLTIAYNRARQTAITQEITEIVGGAAALE